MIFVRETLDFLLNKKKVVTGLVTELGTDRRTDGPTDRPTDGHLLLKGCEDAAKKPEKKKLKNRNPIDVGNEKRKKKVECFCDYIL